MHLSASGRRLYECRRLAERHDYSGEDLYRIANAIWSNLNPQSTPWAIALSAAIAAMNALEKERT